MKSTAEMICKERKSKLEEKPNVYSAVTFMNLSAL